MLMVNLIIFLFKIKYRSLLMNGDKSRIFGNFFFFL